MGITAFDVYLIMQLDSVGGLLFALSVVTAVGFFLAAIVRLAANPDYEEYLITKANAVLNKYPLAVALWLVTALIPSTQTAAAMIILPALTSDKMVSAVQPELQELYKLAKQAVKDKLVPDNKNAEQQQD